MFKMCINRKVSNKLKNSLKHIQGKDIQQCRWNKAQH